MPAETRHRPGQLSCLEEGDAVLGDEHAAGPEHILAGCMERLREQGLRRPDRIGGIDDDHVETALRVRDEGNAVGDPDFPHADYRKHRHQTIGRWRRVHLDHLAGC